MTTPTHRLATSNQRTGPYPGHLTAATAVCTCGRIFEETSTVREDAMFYAAASFATHLADELLP